MKKILILVLFISICSIAFSQDYYQEVIYLKNGTIIKGMIIEFVPNKSIKIKTKDNIVTNCLINEIEKITREPVILNSKEPVIFSSVEGYQGIFEVCHAVGIGDYGENNLKLSIINGYRFSPSLYLGLGTGLKYFYGDDVIIPFFTNVRLYLLDNKTSPFFDAGLGYSFEAKDNFQEVGYFYNLTWGVNIRISHKSNLSFGLGYEMQKMSVTHSYTIGTSQFFGGDMEKFGSLNLTAGISF